MVEFRVCFNEKLEQRWGECVTTEEQYCEGDCLKLAAYDVHAGWVEIAIVHVPVRNKAPCTGVQHKFVLQPHCSSKVPFVSRAIP